MSYLRYGPYIGTIGTPSKNMYKELLSLSSSQFHFFCQTTLVIAVTQHQQQQQQQQLRQYRQQWHPLATPRNPTRFVATGCRIVITFCCDNCDVSARYWRHLSARVPVEHKVFINTHEYTTIVCRTGGLGE